MRASLVLVALTFVVGVCPAFGQDATARGALFRGLFGGAMPLPSRAHVFDVTASVFGSYIENLSESDRADEVPEAWFRGASGSMVYRRNWTKASVGAFAAGGTSYSDQLKDADRSPWVTRWNAGVNGDYSREIARKTMMTVSGTLSYSPDYSFGFGGLGGGGGGIGQGGFLPGFSLGPDRLESIPGLDYTVASQPTLNSHATVRLDRGLTRRVTLETYYNFNAVTFLNAPPADDPRTFTDFQSHNAGARLRYSVNRFVSARAGYGYVRSVHGGADGGDSSHLIDAGVDGGYGQEFQIARRTTFEFNTRSGLFVTDEVNGEGDVAPRTNIFLGGSAALAHRWGRSWQARAQYNRAAGFVDGFTDPVITDRVTATVGGVPLRRLDLMATASYITGSVGFGRDDSDFNTTAVSAQARWAMTRHIAAYAQYLYYTYRFDQGVTLPGSLDPRLERRGGSVGVTAWLPLL